VGVEGDAVDDGGDQAGVGEYGAPFAEGQVGGEITGLDKRWESLPIAEQIALLFPEPVGVLDRHEIRRALVISLTIVYILLLFKGVPMAEHFTWVYLTIIAFYFGSRSLEKFAEIRKKPGQE